MYSIVFIYDWPISSKLNENYINSLEITLKELSDQYNIPTQCIQINSNDKNFNFTKILEANVEIGCQVMTQAA